MASSTLMGDRRWAPTRKSGMTVLGKVPKPINLPSQRLENLGLDPNVEIVPKGTITWGSKAAPNAWVSSGLSSPSADGSSGSPNNGRPTSTSSNGSAPRPSSSSSVPRPSTAGSDTPHDPASNVRGLSSRPSSASGMLASNQTLLASRPRSADTRPGSSHLSRFAESATDNSVSWGTAKATTAVGTQTSKNDGFTLSSGDFPTLGSDKNPEPRGHSSQGHPGSASGRTQSQKVDPKSSSSDPKNVNSWRNDNYSCGGNSSMPNVENWKSEPQQPYSGVSMQHQQFDSWHGPPLQSWYGPPSGPYHPLPPPVAYQVESFAYYPPKMPARSPTLQDALRPIGSVYNPKDVDSYCPCIPPDSFIVPAHPLIPFRPGVYPGPIPYDGYYGPPATFHGSVDREGPVMNLNAGPVSGNQYNQNANVVMERPHATHGPQDSLVKRELKEPSHSHENNQRQYKVLLKHHDGREDNIGKEQMQHSVVTNLPNVGNEKLEVASQDNVQEVNDKKLIHHEQASLCAANDNKMDVTNVKAAGMSKDSHASHVPVSNQHEYPALKMNATLIEKIEGLNNKLRVSDVHAEELSASNREKTKTSKVINVRGEQCIESPSRDVMLVESQPILSQGSTSVLGAPFENKRRVTDLDGRSMIEPPGSQGLRGGISARSQGRRGTFQGRVDDRARSEINNKEDNEWINRPQVRDSHVSEIPAECLAWKSVVGSHSSSKEIVEGHGSLGSTSVTGGSYMACPMEGIDHKAQRAKLIEIATKRIEQLQQEEEERNREQKANALAKLEELNSRAATQGQRENGSVSDSTKLKQTSGVLSSSADASAAEASATAKQKSSSEVKTTGELIERSSNLTLAPSQVTGDPDVPSLELEQQLRSAEDLSSKAASHTLNNSMRKQKQKGYRRRDTNSHDGAAGEKPTALDYTGDPHNPSNASLHQYASASVGVSNIEDREAPIQHRKKNYKGPSHKNKSDVTVASSIPSSKNPEGKKDNSFSESSKSGTSQSVSETISVPSQKFSETMQGQETRDSTPMSTDHGCLPTAEEPHSRAANHWKPQPNKRSVRNHQVLRPVDKLRGNEATIWAPVKPVNKSSPPEPFHGNDITNEGSNNSLIRDVSDVQNCVRTKRAEMERYVPKHAAKELMLRENLQLQSYSNNQTGPSTSSLDSTNDSKASENSIADISTIGKADPPVDSKITEDNKLNRHARVQASWCQHHLPASTSSGQGTTESPISPEVVVSASEATQYKSTKSEISVKETQRGNNLSVASTETSALQVTAKDYGRPSRQRHQQSRSQMVSGSNLELIDTKDMQIGKDGVGNQYGDGDHVRSHWQPKSQASQNYRTGSRVSGAQRTGSGHYSQVSDNRSFRNVDQEALKGNNTSETRGGHAEDFKGQRLGSVDSSKKQSHPVKAFNSESSSTHRDAQPESSMTHQQQGQYGRFFNRRQEVSFRRSNQGQHDGNQSSQINIDRQKSSYYEYQKIRSYNRSGDSFQQNYVEEEKPKGPESHGSRYTERGSRCGGHLYGHRSRSAVRFGNYHDSTE